MSCGSNNCKINTLHAHCPKDGCDFVFEPVYEHFEFLTGITNHTHCNYQGCTITEIHRHCLRENCTIREAFVEEREHFHCPRL